MIKMSDRVKKLHEMVFIYNAVMDGWTVRKLRNGQIRLKKKTKNKDFINSIISESEEIHTQKYDLDLLDFINEHTNINRIFNE